MQKSGSLAGIIGLLLEEGRLAPDKLRSRRTMRYQGELGRITMADFAAEDQDLLRKTYRGLQEIFNLLRPVYTHPLECRDALTQYLLQKSWSHNMDGVKQLGVKTRAGGTGPNVLRALHDLRAGALQALSLRMELVELSLAEPSEAQQVFFLARDHLKIMRNCVSDLDPELFELDSRYQHHSATLLVEKWTSAAFCAADHNVQVTVESGYDGTICESCLEFSTLDRIIYNLMNNASRFTANGKIYFGLTATPVSEPHNVLFVIANAISAEHRAILEGKFGSSLANLMRGGFTTGGSGLGTRIAADFSSQAYGVTDIDEAQKLGIFGARLWHDDFVAWFHWPIVD